MIELRLVKTGYKHQKGLVNENGDVLVLQYRENGASQHENLPENTEYNWTKWQDVPVVEE